MIVGSKWATTVFLPFENGISPSEYVTRLGLSQAIEHKGGVEETRLEAKAKNTKKFQGQGQTLSKPRTLTQVFSKKRSSKNFFQAISTWENQKKVFADFPQGLWRFPTKFQRFKNSAVLEPRTGQFLRTWGFEAKDFKMCPRDQGRPGVLEDVLGLDDVLEDTFWSPWSWPRRSSPWPWPRGLKSSKIGLSSARGQHYFLNCWNFVERLKNFFGKTFFCGDRQKNFCQDLFFWDRLKNFCEDLFFFGEHLPLCPWSLALASSIPVFGLERVCPRKCCPWPRIFFVSLALASSLVSSTPPLDSTSDWAIWQLVWNFCWSVLFKPSQVKFILPNVKSTQEGISEKTNRSS